MSNTLFDKTSIGSMKLKNRIFMSPMSSLVNIRCCDFSVKNGKTYLRSKNASLEKPTNNFKIIHKSFKYNKAFWC